MPVDAASAVYLASLRAALYSGVLIVRHGDTMTTFRSLDEIRQIIAMIEGETVRGTRQRIRYPIQFTKGL